MNNSTLNLINIINNEINNNKEKKYYESQKNITSKLLKHNIIYTIKLLQESIINKNIEILDIEFSSVIKYESVNLNIDFKYNNTYYHKFYYISYYMAKKEIKEQLKNIWMV